MTKGGSRIPVRRVFKHLYLENRLVVSWGGMGRECGVDSEFGVNRCKLSYLEWISNEILLNSTGNYSQSLGIDHDER